MLSLIQSRVPPMRVFTHVAAVVICGFFTFNCFGQGFQVNLYGEKQISMGGVGTAAPLDAASILFNPGALVFQKSSVTVGISPLLLKASYRGPFPSSDNAEFSSVEPPFSAYGDVSLIKNKLKIGLGTYTPFGGAAKWNANWVGKYDVQTLKLRSIFYQPTISYLIAEKLGIGAGFVIGTGTVNLTRAIPLADSRGMDGRASLKGNALGYGFNAGLSYYASATLTLGLDYRSAVNVRVKNGEAIFNVPSSLQTNFPAGNSFSTTLNLPSTASAGLAFKPRPNLLLGLDVNFVGWNSYKSLSFDYSKTTPVLQNTVSPRNYKNSFDIRLGGQYEVESNLFLRGGGSFGASPVKDGYVTPEAPDANRFELSTGLGYAVKHFSIDASFLYVNIVKRTQTNLETGLNGSFKTLAYIPGVGLSYTF